MENVGDGATGVELPCGVEQKVELLNLTRGLRDVPVSGRENGESGKKIRCNAAGDADRRVSGQQEAEGCRVQRSKLEAVARPELGSFDAVAIEKSSVRAALIDYLKVAILARDDCMTTGNIGLLEHKVLVRRSADGGAIGGNGEKVLAIKVGVLQGGRSGRRGHRAHSILRMARSAKRKLSGLRISSGLQSLVDGDDVDHASCRSHPAALILAGRAPGIVKFPWRRIAGISRSRRNAIQSESLRRE